MSKVTTLTYEENFGEEYNNSLPTLGEAISNILQLFDCQRIYGIGGDFAANLIKGLEQNFEVTPSSNEMHAAFTACAQAEIHNLGVCITTYTVGSLPCLSAAALAMTERLPVVFISGAPGENEIHEEALHHTVHPSTSWKAEYDSALQAFATMGMKSERLQGQRVLGQPNIAAEQFYHLVTHAYTHKEPVFIEIPRNLVFAKTQTIRLPQSIQEIGKKDYLFAGSDLILKEIVSKLKQSKKPLLFLGSRTKHNEELRNLLMEFSHRFQIPYATNWLSKGVFDEFDPLCLGSYNGIFGEELGRSYIENEMDYVLDIATSIFPQDCNTAFSSGTHFIEQYTNKTVLKGSALMEQDLVKLLRKLVQIDLPKYSFQRPKETPPPTIQANDPLDFHNLAGVLNQLQTEDKTPYIYLPEVGNSYFCSYGLKNRVTSLGRGWLTNPWYGAMGTSLPYAREVARQIKENGSEDRAIVITGDGGFHFQLNELIHFMKDETSVTIIYMRNNVFDLGKSGDSPIYHCNDVQFDVHKLVSAYGGKSQLCKTVAEFQEYFRHCMKQNIGIKLIEILCEPTPERQCKELQLLNLYIQFRNGVPEAVEEWEKLVNKKT